MKALLIIDMQKDFMPGGSFAVEGGNEIIPLINSLMDTFPLIAASKDWHPKDHISFAENFPGKKVGDVIHIDGYEQKLWPVHCIRDTNGAAFAEGLDASRIDQVFYKGIDQKIDSYSAFFDNKKLRDTGLEKYLKEHGIDELGVVGVATDICIFYSVLDALELGFQVTVFSDACRAIDKTAAQEALKIMEKKKAKVIHASS